MSSQEVSGVSEVTEEPCTEEPETARVAATPDTGDREADRVETADPETAQVETAADAAPETEEVEIHPEDPDDEWSSTPVRSGLRLGAPTAVLLTLVVLAGGFWGGALAEKHHGGSSSASSALSAIASRLAAARSGAGSGSGAAGAGAFAGAGGFGAATSSAASGIVTGVQGNILYVTDSTGALIKVVVSPSVPVTRTAKSRLTGLQTGDTVVVQGTKASNRQVTATSVRATGQGVTTGAGGGAGGFSGGGGAAARGGGGGG
jgi:hypothetical protein